MTRRRMKLGRRVSSWLRQWAGLIISTTAFLDLPAGQGADAFCRLKVAVGFSPIDVYSENENKKLSAYDVTDDFLFFPCL